MADERVRFDFSLFHLRYNDRIGISEIIVPDPIVIERAVAFRTNIGDARILGLETYWEADIWQLIFGKEQRISFSVFTNFSLLHGEYLSGQAAFIGNKVELIPPVSVKTGFNFRYENFKGSFQYTYVQEHFSDATNATFVANATRGLIPSYNVIDLSLSYEWKQFQLQAGINNLTNTAYFTRRATGYPGPGIIPADGRRFYTTLKVRI